jgi:hypothetical protein
MTDLDKKRKLMLVFVEIWTIMCGNIKKLHNKNQSILQSDTIIPAPHLRGSFSGAHQAASLSYGRLV